MSRKPFAFLAVSAVLAAGAGSASACIIPPGATPPGPTPGSASVRSLQVVKHHSSVRAGAHCATVDPASCYFG